MVYQCNDVILTLKKLEFVTDICGVGSYFDGRADRYSDIDFVVKVKDIYPDEALLRITHLLKRTYAPLWSDFANSLMPRKFLVSLFIGGENPFAFLDIGIENQHKDLCYQKERFQNDQWVHLIKLWVMNFKYYIRGTDFFAQRFAKMMKQADISEYHSEMDGFYKLLHMLSQKDSVNKAYLDKLFKELKEV